MNREVDVEYSICLYCYSPQTNDVILLCLYYNIMWIPLSREAIIYLLYY